MTESNTLNPENLCSHLYKDVWEEHRDVDKLSIMFQMQLYLQKRYGKVPEEMTFKERVDELTIQWRNFNTEMTELLERLPFKEWAVYTDKQLAGFTSEEHRLECLYEYIDCFHFFMNIGIYLGVTPREVFNLYITKNKENFDRQDRGYGAGANKSE